jgi:hypothetical protein
MRFARFSLLLFIFFSPVKRTTTTPHRRLDTAEDLAQWKLLAEDTKINESKRRAAIHRHLVRSGLVKPNQLTKWLYREVLNTDLDDPYLGLGKVLFENYPFRREESVGERK